MSLDVEDEDHGAAGPEPIAHQNRQEAPDITHRSLPAADVTRDDVTTVAARDHVTAVAARDTVTTDDYVTAEAERESDSVTVRDNVTSDVTRNVTVRRNTYCLNDEEVPADLPTPT